LFQAFPELRGVSAIYFETRNIYPATVSAAPPKDLYIVPNDRYIARCLPEASGEALYIERANSYRLNSPEKRGDDAGDVALPRFFLPESGVYM